jgi:hypothetical protein
VASGVYSKSIPAARVIVLDSRHCRLLKGGAASSGFESYDKLLEAFQIFHCLYVSQLSV